MSQTEVTTLNLRIFLMGIALSILLSGMLSAAVTNVPADHATIQAAIDAATANDTIIVSDGTYSGLGNRDLDFGAKNLYLTSLNGPQVTVIDCGGSAVEHHIGFNFHSGEDTTGHIQGFTIKNACAGLAGDSAAVICRGASPVIDNCIISGNQAHGIRVIYDAAPMIRNCTISRNSGNGVYVNHFYYPDADLHIEYTLLDHNGGSGIFVHEPRNVYISNCTVVFNVEHGIFVEGMPPKGGEKRAKGREVNYTISAFNGGYGMGSHFGFFGSVVVCSDAYANTTGNYHSFTLDPAGFSFDPLFCDTAAGDYGVAANSQCAQHEYCDHIIGAFGIGCTDVLICGDVDNDGEVSILDVIFLVDYKFRGGPAPAHMEMADVNSDGVVNILDIMDLIEFKFKNGPGLNCPGI